MFSNGPKHVLVLPAGLASLPPKKRGRQLMDEAVSAAATAFRERPLLAVAEEMAAVTAAADARELEESIGTTLIPAGAQVAHFVVDAYVRLLPASPGVVVETCTRFVQLTQLKGANQQKTSFRTGFKTGRYNGCNKILWPMVADGHYALLIVDLAWTGSKD